MNYIKVFRPYNGQQKCCAQIYSNNYSCTLEHILAMATELKNDFKLEDKDIQVQKYAGRSQKGITFVEAFLPNETKIPSGYDEIKEIEYVL